MNICFLCYRGNMFCGGQGVYLYYLTRELAGRGHKITVIVGPPYPEDMPWAEVHREINYQFWGWHQDWLPKDNPFNAFTPINLIELIYRRLGFFPEPVGFSLRAFRTLAGLLKRGARFDLIHDVQSLGFGNLPMRLFGIPMISTVHHPLTVDLRESINQPGKNFIDVMGSIEFYPVLMQSFVARHTDIILTSTKAGKKELETDFRIKPERIRVVGNGLDLNLFKATPGVERDPNKLLFVGYTDGPQKGFYYLLKALKMLPEHIKLVVVDEPNRCWTPFWLMELKLGSRVIFTGKIDDEELIRHYSTASLTVIPSLYEGFGLPALEAMLCGCSVLATRAGALPEIVEDGRTGLLAPPRDPEALAEAIMKLLNDEPLRKRLALQGTDEIRSKYSWSQVAARTEAVYGELLRMRGKTASC